MRDYLIHYQTAAARLLYAMRDRPRQAAGLPPLIGGMFDASAILAYLFDVPKEKALADLQAISDQIIPTQDYIDREIRGLPTAHERRSAKR